MYNCCNKIKNVLYQVQIEQHQYSLKPKIIENVIHVAGK